MENEEAVIDDKESSILMEEYIDELESYVPGKIMNSKDIPLLNDAIPIDSEYFEKYSSKN